MHFGSFSDDETGKRALLQVFQNHYGMTEMNVNSEILGGMSLEEVNALIKSTNINLPETLKEAVIHECGHAKAYFKKSPEAVAAMNEALKATPHKARLSAWH